MIKKIFKAIIIVLLLAIIASSFYVFYRLWQLRTGRIFKVDGTLMTKEQINEIYGGPQGYEVEAKNTPEDTYAKFREALLKNDIEGALQWITPEKREEYRRGFADATILEKYKKLPEVVDLVREKGGTFGNFSGYEYYLPEGQYKRAHSVDFIKSRDGIWLIDFI
jgi:hypothetical protein